MLKEMLAGFSKAAKGAQAGTASEAFGQIRIARALGEEILNATAERRNLVRAVRDFLTSMSLGEKSELVDRILARLALWAFDLPASESHHHSHAGGLLDHLLEVASLTVRELSGPGFRASIDTGVNRREQPLWVYAGMIGAVAHDIGKPFEMTVTAPGTSTPWDPRAEPLRHFCQRYDLAATGSALWHWSPRTLTSHEAHMTQGLELIITPEVKDYLGPRLGSVLAALRAARETGGRPEDPGPAREVAEVVRRADGVSTGRFLRDRRSGARESHPSPQDPSAASADRQRNPEPPELPKPKREEPARIVEAAGPAQGTLPAVRAVPTPVEIIPPPPPEFYQERIPRRRGDPVENEGKLRAELDPARFLDTIKRFIVSMRLSRNGLYTAVYIRPDYTWLALPRALFKVAQILKLPFDEEVQQRMVDALGQSPLVVPAGPKRIPVYAKPRPDCPVCELVRVRTVGFLSQAELARLGTHAFEIVVLSEGQVLSGIGGER